MAENIQASRASKEIGEGAFSRQEEAHLIQRARRGDRCASGLLLERYKDRLVNALYRFSGSYEDAVDVAQETMFLALRNLQRFKGKSAFYTWLYRIGLNEVMSLRRKKSPAILGNLDDGPANVKYSNPVAEAERHEMHDIVEEAIVNLDNELRKVLVLREVEGMSYEEIAQALNIPIGTVKTRIHRARMEMRDALADYANGL